MRGQRTIVVSSTFPASADVVWPKLLKMGTLRYIAWPFMSFSSLHDESEAQWTEGVTYAFRLRPLGLLPYGGLHEIRMARTDKAVLEVQSYERNQIIATWNHYMKLVPLPAGRVCYTDTVRIGAGRLTPAVAL